MNIELNIEVGLWLVWILSLLLITYWIKCIKTSNFLADQHEQKIWYMVSFIILIIDVVIFMSVMGYVTWI